jgi:hypothetical protein
VSGLPIDIEPELERSDSEADEAAYQGCMRRHFPDLRDGELSDEDRMAELAGPDVAKLPEGEAVEAVLRRHRVGGSP